MYILGISAFYHDSAACIIKDGKILAAAQEERFTRIKHDHSFPVNSIKFCMQESNINYSDLDSVVFYEKPFLKFERLLETYLAFAPKGFLSFIKSMPIWIKDKLFQKSKIIIELNKIFKIKKYNWDKKLFFSEHHLSHAASAFYPSPFKEAAILTLDAVGEWTTTSVALGNNNSLKIEKELNFPHSIGLLYSSFTYYLGFKVNSGEYKVMGLAPYGTPKYVDLIKNNLIHIYDDGSFKLNIDFFDFCTGLKMTNKNFNNLFGGPPRKPESKITQKEMDIAASIQVVTEEIVLKIAKQVSIETGQKNLCLAGGVALNCVINGTLNKKKIFENIWIQPAAGDAGGALGAALGIYYLHYKKKRVIENNKDSMKGSLLGPKFDNLKIEKDLISLKANYKKLNTEELINIVAKELKLGKAIGWMQGRMEFGPRSLGNRSIIADPRSKTMQRDLNLKIKFRENFRPFAPSILKEYCSEWFNLDGDSPYMLLVAEISNKKKIKSENINSNIIGLEKLNQIRSIIPAVTHVDYTSRIQTVDEDHNKKYYNLIKKFNELTDCPIIVNTSFNIRGEPIICSPKDAFKCFMGTNLDLLVIENFIMYKNDQNKNIYKTYITDYNLD